MVIRLVIGAGESLGVWCRPSDVELLEKNRLIAGRKGCDTPLAALLCRSGLKVASAHDP